MSFLAAIKIRRLSTNALLIRPPCVRNFILKIHLKKFKSGWEAPMFSRHGIFKLSLTSLALFFAFSQTGIRAEPVQGPGESVPLQGNDHIASIGAPHIPYNSDPPTSGPHVGFVARWGLHSTPVPKELQVHNLEDGGVIIQYNCNDCKDLISNLTRVAKRYNRILLAPYPNLDSKIALTAWGKIDKLQEFDEKRIIRFIEAYIGIDHHPRKETQPPQ
jgi:hypothetical protein